MAIRVSDWKVLSDGNHQKIQARQNFLFGQRVGISFWSSRCVHVVQGGNLLLRCDIVNIFQNAVANKGHLNLTENPGLCSVDGHIKHCGNTRGALWECRCAELNRVTRPQARIAFEDKVIEKFFEHPGVRAACAGVASFDARIAIFAPGGLLGEEILLYRLIDKLFKRGAEGTLHLFLVDRNYQDSIIKGQIDSVMGQFISEMTGCLPTGIQVEATFIGDAQDYINLASLDSSYSHDLLIGADIEGGEGVMHNMQSVSRSRETAPIILQKIRGLAQVCNIGMNGAAVDCDTIYGPVALTYPTRIPPQVSQEVVRPIGRLVRR